MIENLTAKKKALVDQRNSLVETTWRTAVWGHQDQMSHKKQIEAIHPAGQTVHRAEDKKSSDKQTRVRRPNTYDSGRALFPGFPPWKICSLSHRWVKPESKNRNYLSGSRRRLSEQGTRRYCRPHRNDDSIDSEQVPRWKVLTKYLSWRCQGEQPGNPGRN